MTIHKGIHGETLDETSLRVGVAESELVTVGAAGVVEFESMEEREWYEGRVIQESKRVQGRIKHKSMVARNRLTAKTRKPAKFSVRICLTCGKEFQAMGPRALFCTTSGQGNCKDAHYKSKKKAKNQKEV